jgi:hypothetical protein
LKTGTSSPFLLIYLQTLTLGRWTYLAGNFSLGCMFYGVMHGIMLSACSQSLRHVNFALDCDHTGTSACVLALSCVSISHSANSKQILAGYLHVAIWTVNGDLLNLK